MIMVNIIFGGSGGSRILPMSMRKIEVRGRIKLGSWRGTGSLGRILSMASGRRCRSMPRDENILAFELKRTKINMIRIWRFSYTKILDCRLQGSAQYDRKGLGPFTFSALKHAY